MDGENISQLKVLALQAHELYTELISAGFQTDQALYISASVVCGGPRPPSGDDTDTREGR